MPADWNFSDEEMDAFLDEMEAVDREAADYLLERMPELEEELSDADARWIAELVETIAPADPPAERELEGAASVAALQHADWLGLVLGVARRGAGGVLDAEAVLADVEALEEIEGEVEDPGGYRDVVETALLHLSAKWQQLGVIDGHDRVTERGVWGIPRALHELWSS